jgi:hypothetical protein
MGRAQQKRTNDMNDTARANANTAYGNFNKVQGDTGGQFQSNSNQSFSGASGVYDKLANGFDASDPNYMAAGSGGRYGGYTAKTMTAEGYDSKQPQFHLKAIDPNNLAGARAGYDEFAKTGGMDDASQQNFRLRGNAAVPSFYSNLKQQMDTRRAVQGGYGAGFDASDAALSRRAAQDTYSANLNTEGTLQDKILSGRQFGIAGQADVGKFADDLQYKHDIGEGGFSEDYANRQDQAGMFSADARNRAQQFNIGEQNNASASSASAAGANAALDERAREFNADQDYQRRATAGEGYSGLYGASNTAESAAYGRQLGGLGGNDQQNANSINSRFEYNKPWGQQLANSLVSGGASAASAYFGGGFRKTPRAGANP